MEHVQNWSAALQHDRLTVNGEYSFPTTGYTVHLAKKEPQEKNSAVLELEKIVTKPAGVVADHVVTIPVKFEEQTPLHYKEVVILPDNTRIQVRNA